MSFYLFGFIGGLLGIVVILLIVALFTKKDYGLVREIRINQPKATVFNYILLLQNQDNFTVWSRKDPEMIKGFLGTDGTVGAVSTWESKMKDVGKGEQEITKIQAGVRVDFELRFIKPFASTSYAWFETEDIKGAQTKVIWGFSGKMNYPMNLMLLTMDMEKMIGKDFEDGLNKLKEILEK